jgi:hypothetical protein
MNSLTSEIEEIRITLQEEVPKDLSTEEQGVEEALDAWTILYDDAKDYIEGFSQMAEASIAKLSLKFEHDFEIYKAQAEKAEQHTKGIRKNYQDIVERMTSHEDSIDRTLKKLKALSDGARGDYTVAFTETKFAGTMEMINNQASGLKALAERELFFRSHLRNCGKLREESVEELKVIARNYPNICKQQTLEQYGALKNDAYKRYQEMEPFLISDFLDKEEEKEKAQEAQKGSPSQNKKINKLLSGQGSIKDPRILEEIFNLKGKDMKERSSESEEKDESSLWKDRLGSKEGDIYMPFNWSDVSEVEIVFDSKQEIAELMRSTGYTMTESGFPVPPNLPQKAPLLCAVLLSVFRQFGLITRKGGTAMSCTNSNIFSAEKTVRGVTISGLREDWKTTISNNSLAGIMKKVKDIHAFQACTYLYAMLSWIQAPKFPKPGSATSRVMPGIAYCIQAYYKRNGKNVDSMKTKNAARFSTKDANTKCMRYLKVLFTSSAAAVKSMLDKAISLVITALEHSKDQDLKEQFDLHSELYMMKNVDSIWMHIGRRRQKRKRVPIGDNSMKKNRAGKMVLVTKAVMVTVTSPPGVELDCLTPDEQTFAKKVKEVFHGNHSIENIKEVVKLKSDFKSCRDAGHAMSELIEEIFTITEPFHEVSKQHRGAVRSAYQTERTQKQDLPGKMSQESYRSLLAKLHSDCRTNGRSIHETLQSNFDGSKPHGILLSDNLSEIDNKVASFIRAVYDRIVDSTKQRFERERSPSIPSME